MLLSELNALNGDMSDTCIGSVRVGVISSSAAATEASEPWIEIVAMDDGVSERPRAPKLNAVGTMCRVSAGSCAGVTFDVARVLGRELNALRGEVSDVCSTVRGGVISFILSVVRGDSERERGIEIFVGEGGVFAVVAGLTEVPEELDALAGWASEAVGG